jgi:UDP-N-acetylmuramate dehydrogenase
MNAGTRDGCITDPLEWVDFLDDEGFARRLEKSEFPIGYRTTGIPEGWVVTGAGFILEQGNRTAIREKLFNIMKQRKNTQPLGLPSAGCVFKNPAGLSAGALIQRSGLKGFRVGDAEVSEKHANWIINCGKAKAADIFALIRHIQQKVFRDFGVLLELEIKVLAFPGADEPIEFN